MMPIIQEILKYSSTPVIVNPNAGLPVVRNGKTEYDVSSADFARSMEKSQKNGRINPRRLLRNDSRIYKKK
ncbi:MAG: hypothetical protein L6V93_11850 [Clostridiales bacterium]|nr:MAG: hypothetical protein L6V93_11850 [Clostridiales bacterium]